MFTGLVEEVGIITNHINTKDGIEIEIDAAIIMEDLKINDSICLLYTSPSPRDGLLSRMPSSA